MNATAKIKGMFAFGILLLAGTNINAQETTTTTTTTTSVIGDTQNYDQGFRLGFGLNAGYVLDDDYFDGLALGADVRLQYDLSKRTSITLTTGYDHFFVDDNLQEYYHAKDIGMIPVKAGFKAFFWGDSFYAMGEAGAGFVVSKRNPYSENTTVILSPGIGYANKWIDISARYEHYTEFETGQVALRIAYGFKL